MQQRKRRTRKVCHRTSKGSIRAGHGQSHNTQSLRVTICGDETPGPAVKFPAEISAWRNFIKRRRPLLT